jgi:diacylglycerol O-acyltransferase / wax synthase
MSPAPLPVDGGPAPRRVLIVSADIGGGHHATGRALEAAVRERWPAAEVVWVDTLDAMHAGPGFRWIYRANVETTPWLYDFFYDRIRRYRWFARSSKWVTSVWAGWRLAPVLRREQPDLILSTYPLGSGGLAWLRRRGKLATPVGAWISDFAPHPFWVHDPLDLHVVMHPDCVELAHRAEPDARVVGPAALPVVPAFHDGDRTAARAALGLATEPYTALVSCGVYGFGAVEEAVDVLLQVGGDRVQVVVAAGRNEGLRRRLERHPDAGGRLRVFGWTDRMPELTRAADVVVTNAGGATSLEALACGRPVLMFRSIAGHGIANARAMADAGVAVLCADEAALGATLRRLLEEPGFHKGLELATASCTSEGSLADDVARLLTPTASAPAAAPSTLPLTAEDAFWVHVDSDRVPQHAAALALIRPAGEPVGATALHDALAATVPIRPWLTWRLDARPGSRPRWRTGEVTSGERLPVTPLSVGGDERAAARAFDEFVAAPMPSGEPAWEVRGAEDWPGGRTGMLIRAHHAFGDGFAVLDAFTGITTRRPGEQPTASGAPAIAPAGDRQVQRRPARERLRTARATARGLLSLARAGAAPPTPLGGPRSGSLAARHALLTLPDAAVRRAARAAGVGTSDLVVAVVAEAVHLFLIERGTPSPSGTVRAMVPRTRRGPAGSGPGNRTSAVRVDLPVGEMPAVERARRGRDAVARAVAQGQQEGASFVLALAARLPARLHAAVARWVYRSTWFDLIVSVIPGPRTARWFGQARVEQAWAVLPLAEGVGLAVGALTWDGKLSVAVSWDPVLLPDGDRLAELIGPAFDALAATESPPAAPAEE